MLAFVVLLALVIDFVTLTNGALKGCAALNYCSGHGRCTGGNRCECYEGFTYAFDCSLRNCPNSTSWGDLPTSTGQAHAEEECSGKGICDRKTGQCKCVTNYEGIACSRSKCPTSVNGHECSGHGQCMSMEMLATKPNAMPVSPATAYRLASYVDNITINRYPWDHDKIYGCLCDSTWKVGLGAGETQEGEWFGPDCSLRHCPSGDNPRTTNIDETNCSSVVPTGLNASIYAQNFSFPDRPIYIGRNNQLVGKNGNLCQVDCSNQGICDYKSGVCSCFKGHFGVSCSINAALATPTRFESYSTILDGGPVEIEPVDFFYADADTG